MYEKDSIKVADSLKLKTVKGRTVYEGGGIIPDVFVPLEGKHGDEAIEMIMQYGVVSYYVFEQLDKNRKEFTALNYSDFLMKMEATEDYFKGFQKHLTKSGLAIPLDANKALVKRYLTAEFARQLYDDEKYYEIILKEDAMVKAVLNLK